ncbi:MAG: bifunctional diaminohydroxyphosphoribosylaminopyrimidine deaminase/5-amino-6-(5-phosphoribosylamino)uracil reductase RibD [Rickettsiales bacterium]
MQNRDILFLHHALRLAERGLGRTWPNPSVGSVLVKDDVLLAVARTGDGGRPHAEAQALAIADAAARGATAYVSLEPCAHQGQTTPCAQALIDAGVARVVIAAVDPDARVNGKGIAMLKAAGIEVEVMALPEAALVNRGFFRRIQQGLPYVAMKLATSLDNRLSVAPGVQHWVTGEMARAHGHRLRGMFDCVITGIGTVLIDDPLYTVRAPNAPHTNLVRVVCDRSLRLPLTSKLVKTANQHPVWLITHAAAVENAASHATELREAGVKFMVLEDAALSPTSILKALAGEGITRALVEAGGGLSAAFLDTDMVETLHWYRAPVLLGNAGQSAIDALDNSLQTIQRSQLLETRTLGGDIYERYELR